MTTEAEAREWIRQYAESARVAARQVLEWHLDALRLRVGLVEVVQPGDVRIGDRMIPTGTDEHGQAWCVLVRDVEVEPPACRRCEGEGVMPLPDPDPSVVTSRMPDWRCPDCMGTGTEY